MLNVLIAVLCHQDHDTCHRIVRHWHKWLDTFNWKNDLEQSKFAEVLLLYGGEKSEFDKIPHEHTAFMDDSKLRTSDHQREKQSYTQCFQKILQFQNQQNQQKTKYLYDYVLFAEYDFVPILPNDFSEEKADFVTTLIAQADREKASAIFHHLQQIDGRNHPHYLYHMADKKFEPFWQKTSKLKRKQKSQKRERQKILTALLPGAFFTMQAVTAIAENPEQFPIYMEIFIPTLLHHLGFKVVQNSNPEVFVSHKFSAKFAKDLSRWQAFHPLRDFFD